MLILVSDVKPLCVVILAGCELMGVFEDQGALNPLLNFQPPCILHLQRPADQLSPPPGSGFWPQVVFFAIKCRKPCILLEN